MVNLLNYNIEDIKRITQHKLLILWGAGKRADYFLRMYHMESTVKMIIDNDEGRKGEFVANSGTIIPVYGIEALFDQVKQNGVESILLVITPRYFDIEIIDQLDHISLLEGMDCCLASLVDDYYEKQRFEFTRGRACIPKKIHYCWFGKKEIPLHLKKYIDGWHELCPDYDIICWNEDNYDIKKNRYMFEAYQAGRYGFVPDYARLDIIYQEGGIYLDTDVELLKRPDDLLADNMFCGFNCYGMVALGLGFGAVAKHDLIGKLRDAYENVTFYMTEKDGSVRENLTACVWYQNPILEDAGFVMNNSWQKRNGVVVYPSEVLAPTGGSGMSQNFTDKTISIHHAELSWITEDARKCYHKKREFLYNRSLKVKCN